MTLQTQNKTISATLFDNKNKTIQVRIQQYNIKTKKWNNVHKKVTLTESANINIGEKCSNNKNSKISNEDFGKSIRSGYQKILKRVSTNSFLTGGNSEYFVLFEIATKQVIYFNLATREIRAEVISNKRHETDKGVHFNASMPLSKTPVKQPLVEPFQSDYVEVELPLTKSQNENKKLKEKINQLEQKMKELEAQIQKQLTNEENIMNKPKRISVESTLTFNSTIEENIMNKEVLEEKLKENEEQLRENEALVEKLKEAEDLEQQWEIFDEHNERVKHSNECDVSNANAYIEPNVDEPVHVEKEQRSFKEICDDIEQCIETSEKLSRGDYGSKYSEVKEKLNNNMFVLINEIGVEMSIDKVSKHLDSVLYQLYQYTLKEVA